MTDSILNLTVTRFTVEQYATHHGLTVAVASKLLRRAALDSRLRVKEMQDYQRTYHGLVVTFDSLAAAHRQKRARGDRFRRQSKSGPTAAVVGAVNRGKIAAALQDGLTATGEIARAVGLSRATVNRHKRALHRPEAPARVTPWTGLIKLERKRA